MTTSTTIRYQDQLNRCFWKFEFTNHTNFTNAESFLNVKYLQHFYAKSTFRQIFHCSRVSKISKLEFPKTSVDCRRNAAAVCNLRQNSIRDKFQSETIFFFVRKKNFVRKKICLEFCLALNFVSDTVSDFQCTFFELSRTNR